MDQGNHWNMTPTPQPAKPKTARAVNVAANILATTFLLGLSACIVLGVIKLAFIVIQ